MFCRPSLLQLSLYRHLLTSRVVRSCLTSHSSGGSRHLVCIGALKKLCNDPSLIYSHCQEAKEMEDSLDVDEVSYFWSAGHLKQTRMFCCCVDPLSLSNFIAIYFRTSPLRVIALSQVSSLFQFDLTTNDRVSFSNCLSW